MKLLEAQQEARSERVTITVTPEEKKAVRAVSLLRDTDESSLLRTTLLADVVQAYERSRTAADAA